MSMIQRAAILMVLTTCALARAGAIEVADGKEPQLATNGARACLVFGRDDAIYVASSADGGTSFDPPALVAHLDKLMLGMRRGPRVAVAADAIVVTAIGARDGDLLAWRSTDAGKTWSGPARINDEPRAAREGLHHLASDGDRKLYAVWLDLRTGHTRVEGALSRDAGLTWEANELIYESPDGHVCECCQPSAAFLPDGRVAVMFRNYLDGNRDMYLARFTPGQADRGAQATKVGTPTWRLNACPMDGGALSVDPKTGDLTAVWRSDQTLYLTRGTDQRELGHGMQAWVSGDDDVWTEARVGKLLWQHAGQQPTVLNESASDPVVTAGLCAWTTAGKVYVTRLGPVGK